MRGFTFLSRYFNKSQKARNKKVVYTMIFAGYDDLKEPEFVSPDFDYVCFTDDPDLKSDVWQIRLVKIPHQINPKRYSGEFSTYPFSYLKEYDLSVYVNGAISIKCNISKFVDQVLPETKSIVSVQHPKRDCIYEEAIKVVQLKKDYPVIVARQMEKYRKDGFPDHYGLQAFGLIVRRHNDNKLKKHCRFWRREVRNYSQRDQLSFNYVQWKYKLVEPAYISWDYFLENFIPYKHLFVQKFE